LISTILPKLHFPIVYYSDGLRDFVLQRTANQASNQLGTPEGRRVFLGVQKARLEIQ